MEDTKQKLVSLQIELDAALKQIGYNELYTKVEARELETHEPGFWRDNLHAQEVMKELATTKKRLEPWQRLRENLHDIAELCSLSDQSMEADLATQVRNAQEQFQLLKEELRYSGIYDDRDAILSIYAGAGGTDAQDWAQMLLRMYTRYGEREDYVLRTLDQSFGEEAGLKSVTFELNGQFAYGKLKGEHGVHRLVRLSPFNADHLRQTSFARVDVLPKIDKPNELELDDKDLRIDVYRSGGHGGQSVNTTDSAVRITHIPTNISVAIQNERSQLQNKEAAMTILRSKLVQLQLEQHKEKLSEIKGPSQSAEWGNQIRSYVLHPYKQVKDLRTNYETSDVNGVLDGKLENFINAYFDMTL
jgi:peptide chain release factor 2